MMIQVLDGEITRYSLPRTGTLSTGETVSGYHLLPPETLAQEGWLPVEDIKPEYDAEAQVLVSDGFEILPDKVIKKYRVEPLPEPRPDLRQQIGELQQVVDTLLTGGETE